MPRHTHPRPRAKHDRAHTRFHRDRVIAKRWRQAKDMYLTEAHPDDVRYGLVEATAADWPFDRPPGELAREQAWIGCRRPRCGLCHPHKRWGYGDRQRDERVWRRDADA